MHKNAKKITLLVVNCITEMSLFISYAIILQVKKHVKESTELYFMLKTPFSYKATCQI